MSGTPNLGLDHIAASQAQKEVTHNAAIDGLDRALCGLNAIELTTGSANPMTVPATVALSCMALRFTGSPPVGFRANLPAVTKLYVIHNIADKAVAVGTAAAGLWTTTVGAGAAKMVYCDSGNVFAV